MLHVQQRSDDRKGETTILDIFLKPKEMPDMAGGLQYFLQNVVSKTGVAGSKSDRNKVKRGCKLAGDALRVLSVQKSTGNE